MFTHIKEIFIMLIINHTSNSKYYLSIGSLLKLEHSLVEATHRFPHVEEYAKDFIVRAMNCRSDVNFLSSAHDYINLIPIVFVTQAQSKTSFYANLRTPFFNYNQIVFSPDGQGDKGTLLTQLNNSSNKVAGRKINSIVKNVNRRFQQ